MEKIYVIGHKSPDLDSVSAAINYAALKNKLENTDAYTPVIAGEINSLTSFVLEKFGFEKPQLLENLAGKNVILVDHNEASQSQDGIGEAAIVEVLDHHKMDFKNSNVIRIDIRPWGSSNTIIYSIYKDNDFVVDKNLAGFMLSALLDDTVVTKSPTCTDLDKEYIEELAKIAGIPDWQSYGIEMFKVKSSMKDKSAMEIIKNDFKDFDFKQGKFGIGQVETVDLSEFEARYDELLAEMKNLHKTGGYHSVILFITDIIKEGSQFLVVTDDMEKVEEALTAQLENNMVYIAGIISRKKQVAPKFDQVFNK